ncbi:MAG: serine hydrolase domain-containing protein [Acidimicrobiales bacterium]
MSPPKPLRSALAAATAVVTRQCHVPDDLETVVQRGIEDADHDGAEAVWSRAQGMYRSGVHPGIQVCIRWRGDVVLDRAIGHARGNRVGRRLDAARAVPLATDTPINLFSAGKSVTAMAMHKLEEQGALSLDDAVSAHLPEFARHGKESITLRQLITHRAGIPQMPPEALDLELLADLDRVVDHLCDLPVQRPPAGPPAYPRGDRGLHHGGGRAAHGGAQPARRARRGDQGAARVAVARLRRRSRGRRPGGVERQDRRPAAATALAARRARSAGAGTR